MISSASEVGVVFLHLQVILGAGVTMGPVMQAPDQTSLDVGGMVDQKSRYYIVRVSVSGLSVDCDLKVAVTLPPDKCVQEWECSVLLDFHSKVDGRLHSIEVV